MKNNQHAGQTKLESLGGSAELMIAEINKICPAMANIAVNHVCGDIYCRPGLDTKSREMIAIAALTATNNLPHVKLHIEAALQCGVSPTEIKEIIIQTYVYGGLASALNAMLVAKEVFEKHQLI